jgi:Holliday junction resolvase
MGESKKQIWDEIHEKDVKDEKRVKEWLKRKGFEIKYWHKGKRSNMPYDIKAEKHNKKWIIEVKGGHTPKIKLENFRKMLTDKSVDVVGLALVIDRHPYLIIV